MALSRIEMEFYAAMIRQAKDVERISEDMKRIARNLERIADVLERGEGA
jgi:hypothetical protein